MHEYPRPNARDMALQLAHNPDDKPEDVVRRAEEYFKFLTKKD